MSWQPIDTAPKDGTRILLWTEDRVVIGRWYDNALFGLGWRHDDGNFTEPDGMTHWMPVPGKPAES
jgi:hypothetical protein